MYHFRTSAASPFRPIMGRKWFSISICLLVGGSDGTRNISGHLGEAIGALLILGCFQMKLVFIWWKISSLWYFRCFCSLRDLMQLLLIAFGPAAPTCEQTLPHTGCLWRMDLAIANIFCLNKCNVSLKHQVRQMPLAPHQEVFTHVLTQLLCELNVTSFWHWFTLKMQQQNERLLHLWNDKPHDWWVSGRYSCLYNRHIEILKGCYFNIQPVPIILHLTGWRVPVHPT